MIQELEKSLQMIHKMYSETIQIMESGEQEKAVEMLKQKDQIIDLDINMRKAHMSRVASGICSLNLTMPFSQVLYCIDRIGNSCVNITEAISGQIDFSYFMIEKNQ